ncbi:hypothetical protein [Spirosoma lituiforme]
MKTTHTLIVNKNGLVSACPTHDLFDLGSFVTDPNLVVSMPVLFESEEAYQDLYDNRDNAFVLHESLPHKASMDGRVWFRLLKSGILKRAV